MPNQVPMTHPGIARRLALQAGAVGILNLGMNHVSGLRALAAGNSPSVPTTKPKGVIYIFLSGGLVLQLRILYFAVFFGSFPDPVME